MVAADIIDRRDGHKPGEQALHGREVLRVAGEVARQGDEIRLRRGDAGEQRFVALSELLAVDVRELHDAEAVKFRGQAGAYHHIFRRDDAQGAVGKAGGDEQREQQHNPPRGAAARSFHRQSPLF